MLHLKLLAANHNPKHGGSSSGDTGENYTCQYISLLNTPYKVGVEVKHWKQSVRSDVIASVYAASIELWYEYCQIMNATSTFYCKITSTELTILVQVLKLLTHGEINVQNWLGLTKPLLGRFPIKVSW